MKRLALLPALLMTMTLSLGCQGGDTAPAEPAAKPAESTPAEGGEAMETEEAEEPAADEPAEG